jgi:hypothetical protein
MNAIATLWAENYISSTKMLSDSFMTYPDTEDLTA